MHETINTQDFDKKKRVFFVKLGLKYRKLLSLHRDSGQMSRYSDFGKNESGLNKRWGDPTQHCLVEAAGSIVLGEMLGLSSEDQEIYTTAALVHDAGKRREIETIKRAKAMGVVGQELDHVNDEAYAESKYLLLKAGVDERAVALTEDVAHTSLGHFAELQPDNSIILKGDVSVLSMAMHYLDDITKGQDIVNFDERIDGLEAVAAERYPYNEEGRAKWGGRTYFEAQREVGHLIQARLAEIAGIDDPSNLPHAINDGLVELVTSS